MPVNRYDTPALAPIVNSYVPIDFNNLYRIGMTQKSAIDDAAEELSTAVQKFGEFRSPSRVDTERYYAETLGRIAPYIELAAADPDRMKDAGWRASLQSALNNLNYANISQLRESADNLRAGLEMRAKMEAAGTYNENWDLSDIANYDTIGSGAVFSDITPVAYMSANELSDPYFNNLKPSDLGQVTRNGVRYNRTGINYDTLYNIANARFNDLVRTPQGLMYYRDLLLANNNNSEAARTAFVRMVADSLRDRIVNLYDVDPAWLVSYKASLSRRPGSQQTTSPVLQRLDLINSSVNTLLDEVLKQQMNTLPPEERTQVWRDYQKAVTDALKVVTDATTAYNQNPNNDNLLALALANDTYYRVKFGPLREATRNDMLAEFLKHANFSANETLDSDEFVNKNYNKGVQAALDKNSVEISISPEDPLFTRFGGAFGADTDEYGNATNVWGYANSSGFLLPETIFTGVTGAPARSETTQNSINPLIPTIVGALSTPDAISGIFRAGVNYNLANAYNSLAGSTDIAFRQLFEGGNLNSVTFTPTTKAIRTGSGQLAVKGTVRIPLEEIEDKLGTGGLFRESTEDVMKELYGAAKVERKVGNDNVEYLLFTAYKTLPQLNGTASEATNTINQLYYNSPSNAGVGSTSLAGEQYPYTSISSIN